MEVILKKTVKGVGNPGDLVKVSDGHARNYLLPRKLAVEATPENLKIWKNQARQQTVKQEKREMHRRELADKISGLTCTIQKQVSEEDRIFGSVSVPEILKCLETEHVVLEKKQVILDKPIKTLGQHLVKIKLGQGIETTLKIIIEK
ncbi:50S ribosomal protein L9 [bacterium]|nr:50S ribosomal protein L9 [candidate division CSSED10-310 bacterium]